MKKILIFSLAYYPNAVSGAEAAIKEITDRISPDDIEFHLVTLRYDSSLPREEVIGNVRVFRIGITKKNPSFEDLRKYPLHINKPLYQFYAAWKAHRLHQQHRYDAIWAMMAHSAGVPAALFKMLHPTVPYILSLQEGDPIAHIERVMRPLAPLFTRAFTTADVVQALSPELSLWAKSKRHRGEVEIIFNGANPRDFEANFTPDELRVVEKHMPRDAGQVYLLTASRLVHKNAVDDCIRALSLLPEKVKLVVIGGGPDGDMLQSLARDTGVASRVIFMGQLERTEVSKFRANCDIFVRPSRSEGLGNALLSAMASRRPVIATQEGGIAQFLFDAQRNPGIPPTGFAVDPDSPKQIAEKVTYVLAHPEEVKRVTDTAYRMVYEKFNWDAIARDMRHRVFAKALGK